MQPGKIFTPGAATLGAALMAAVGCHGRSTSPGHELGGPAISGPAHRLEGVVLGKSAQLKEITVHQGVIPNFEPAMNAVYKVSDAGLLGRLEPGDEITGKVIPSETDVVYSLEDVAITSQPRAGTSEEALPPHRLLTGEQAPEVSMVDQDGRKIEFGKYRGKALLITFIDSKCTDDCPILMKRFERVNTLLSADAEAYAASHLISISIDPASDTPPVLRKYGLGFLDGKAAGFSHWEFADATPANLKRLATAFGLVYMEDHGDIDHNMQTALIGPDGKLVQVWGGDD
jgi:protein SCO1/2